MELPARDAVEDRHVLDRVRVADLVRAHEERLVVLVVLRPPENSVERALRADRELELDRSVLELDMREHRHEAARHDTAPAEVGHRFVPRLAPAPRVGVDGTSTALRTRGRAAGQPVSPAAFTSSSEY